MAEIYNNPGNIQIGQGFAGTVGEYASDRQGGGKQPYVEFDSPQMGLRAIFKDLRSKVNTFDGDVAKIISKYAPNNENETQAYIDSVIKQIGSDTITADNMDAAVRAIVRHENGTNSETTKYYLDDPNLLKEAKELAQYDMPATMTYEKAAETYLIPPESNSQGIKDIPQEIIKKEISTVQPNFYANQNMTPPKDGSYTLPPDQIITPYTETIEEDVIVQPQTINVPQFDTIKNVGQKPYQRSENERMQEAARRSMMQGNTQDRMNEYEFARYDAQEDPRSYAQGASSYALPPMQAAQRMMGGGMGYAQGGTVDQAQGLASLGRGGDSTLVHMQPQEVAGLQQLAQSNGTSLTRNPMTGYPEAFSLGGVLKAAAPIAVGAMMPGFGTAIAAGALTGGTIAAATGDDVLAGAVSGGFGGASGSGFGEAFAGVPEAATATGTATSNMGQQLAADAAYTGSLGGMQPLDAVANIGVPSSSIGASQLNTLNPMGGAGASPFNTSGMYKANVGQGQLQTSMMTPKASMNPFKADALSGTSPAGRGYNKFMDNVSDITGTDEMRPIGDGENMLTPGFQLIDGKPMVATGERISGSFLDKAKMLGAPVSSMGIGGLEASDFINETNFDDPRDKYDPRSKLNLSRDTGISEAMSRDTGLRLLAKGGYLKGPGDGMSDDIPATINGDEPAALADGEFVVPADVVSHLGNGSSEAGSKQLYAMMDRIRKARTGRESQGKEIKPGKYMPR